MESRYVINNTFELRSIKPDEAEEAILVEQTCFPPHEVCSPDNMRERISLAPDLFLVAIDVKSGKMAGTLNGLSTGEKIFRDEFFVEAGLYDSEGENVMLLGLDVLPEYRRMGLANALVHEYIQREKKNGRKKLILTCLEEKIKIYRKMGFTDLGPANSTWGGEQWHEMVYTI